MLFDKQTGWCPDPTPFGW